MSKSFARVEVDLSSLDKSLKAALRGGEDLRPVWKKLRTPLKKAQRSHLTSQRTMDGGGFSSLAPSTIARRLSRGGSAKKFTKKGKLRKSASRRLGRILSKKLVSRARTKMSKRSISYFARGAVAHALHGGTKAGRRRRSKIPAREYVFVDDKLAKVAFDMVSKRVAESFNKGRPAR